MRITRILLAVICTALFDSGCSKQEPDTYWTGMYPSGEVEDTRCPDPGFYGKNGPPTVTGSIKAMELGFRADGVVVWRMRNAE